MAQAVEDLAVNAHISLRELRNCVDKVLEKKIPGYKQLMETNPVVAARATVNGATITAYTNGYAVYEADDAHTVLDVNRCGDYRYDFNDGTYEVVPAEVFEDAEWTVRLVMEGERRLEKSERVMTTPLFMLRCVQLGISIADLDLLTIGLVNDMFTERQNDEYPYQELASQADFDRF